jgi:HSP20 family molecular chaperone IbpA
MSRDILNLFQEIMDSNNVPLNVFGGFPVYLPMAGATKEKLSVEIVNRNLLIKCDITVGNYVKKIREEVYIPYSYDIDLITVKLENGLLVINYDKKPEQTKSNRKIVVD